MDGSAILTRLTERFGSAIHGTSHDRDEPTAIVEASALLELLGFCRDDPALRMDMLMDLTAVDYLKYPDREDGPRFEVVYHLYSVGQNHRLRVKVGVDGDEPEVPSAVPLWPIANWYEREVWDMFGIRFAGHPDLRRLLLYEEFVGHPLRKDYPMNRRQPLIGPRN
jgi:NADH-quinone oxidoreductase subunit C